MNREISYFNTFAAGFISAVAMVLFERGDSGAWLLVALAAVNLLSAYQSASKHT